MKRKKSKANFEKKTSMSRKVTSFWSNAGRTPVAAINPTRPFDFSVGTEMPTRPYTYGSIQHVITEFKIPDDWVEAECFKLTCAHLFQDIRENLRSNLSYDEIDLRCYLANVMWIQALLSVMQRDFAFKYFRDDQHPTFDKVWGYVVTGDPQSPFLPETPGVSIEAPVRKTYLAEGSYAENLTYMETVVVPASKGIILPPAMAEYLKWIFDGVFTDETDVSRGQYYWNEIRRIPIYGINASRTALEVIGFFDSTTVQLSAVGEWLTSMTADFGTIIADLKRCGAQMVFPSLEASAMRTPIMKYDEIFFNALENAYTHGGSRVVTVPVLGTKLLANAAREFFMVDITPGMNDEQIASAFSFLGGLDPTTLAGDISIPIFPLSQYALVYAPFNDTQLLTHPFAYLSDASVVYPSNYDSGVYALRYTSRAGSYTAFDPSGSIVPVRNLNTSDTYYVGDGYAQFTFDQDMSPLEAAALERVYIPFAYDGNPMTSRKALYWPSYFSEGTVQHATYQIPTFGWNTNNVAHVYHVSVPSPSAHFIQISSVAGFFTPFAYASGMTAPMSGASTASFAGPNVELEISLVPKDFNTYQITLTVVMGTSAAGFQLTNAFTAAASPGTLSVGEQIANASSYYVDPSQGVDEYLMGEISHHIPRFNQMVVHDLDSGDLAVGAATLVKRTRNTTTYSRTELSAFLYQLYYSLMFVHAKTEKPTKRA